MRDQDKTKGQLMDELVELRQWVTALEAADTERKRAEGEIRKLNQFLDSIIDNANVWLDVLDKKANVVIWNKAAEEISGYSREEVVGHGKIWEWLYPDEEYRNGIIAEAVAIIEDGREEQEAETTIRRKDGQTRVISWNSRSLVDEKGTSIGSIALGRDITERKRVEEALRESEEKYRTILENIEDSYYEVDIVGNFTFFNDSLCRLLGYREHELMGMNNRQYMDDENAKRVYQTFNAAYRTGEPARAFDWEVIRKDGTRRFVEASVSLMRDSTGEPVGFRGVVRDVTERKRVEREIEERRMYLEEVLRDAPDAIVTLNAHHRIVEWNPGAERLFGYSQEEAIGQNLDHLITRPDVFEEAVGFTQRVMGGGGVPPTETVRYRKDGSPVDVIVAGSPILVGDELIGVVAVYTDITQRKRMEDTLRALALIDELTGLYNRRGFFTLAEQQLKTADRTKRRMLLIFADFDGLKQINDAFGHSEGDRALIEIASILRKKFRESDIIARIGGDEFAVLAIETNGSPTEVLTTRLQENLEAINAREGRRYELSLSMGIARYDPEHPCSIDELLAQADRAMYERKQGNQKS